MYDVCGFQLFQLKSWPFVTVKLLILCSLDGKYFHETIEARGSIGFMPTFEVQKYQLKINKNNNIFSAKLSL